MAACTMHGGWDATYAISAIATTYNIAATLSSTVYHINVALIATLLRFNHRWGLSGLLVVLISAMLF